jgi:hypothetical protein
MGVGRLTDFYNVRHANDLQVEPLDVVPVATRWPTDPFEAAAKAPPPRIRAGASVLELGAGDGRLAESLRIGGVDFESYSILELSEIRLVYIETPNIAKWTRHMRLTIGGSPSMFGEVELVAYA